MAETPHLDIFVDGNFEDCATTWNAVSFDSVVANATHTHPETDNCTTTVMADPSHLDLSVNNVYVNCSIAQDVVSFSEPQGVTNPSVFGGAQDVNTSYIGLLPSDVDGTAAGDSQFQGTIDEVRLWTVDRSADIATCKDAELTSSGACALNSDILKGYWKMNECSGGYVAAWSGAGSPGGIEK